ncbi:MAG: hypothetical protein IKZ41_09225, partial [Clostridia bacterium]|nr:hypothetical protein [Clostridia bacterium]
MRNRKVQRMLRKAGEKGLSPRDSTGLLDLTPFEAVKEIIKKEKAEAIREAKEKLKTLEESGEETAVPAESAPPPEKPA